MVYIKDKLMKISNRMDMECGPTILTPLSENGQWDIYKMEMFKRKDSSILSIIQDNNRKLSIQTKWHVLYIWN